MYLELEFLMKQYEMGRKLISNVGPNNHPQLHKCEHFLYLISLYDRKLSMFGRWIVDHTKQDI